MVELLEHQKIALKQTEGLDHVAYYLDMGLGKTYVASEKLKSMNFKHALVICQKSKIKDWMDHFKDNYEYDVIQYKNQPINELKTRTVIVINYDSVWRKPELKKLKNFVMILDESQYIKNERSKRAKFILKLKPDGVILLSGTPTGGKYEELWSQCQLLNWTIKKTKYYSNYIIERKMKINGFEIKQVKGYKNVSTLKRKLRRHGAVFMKTEEVIDLPDQIMHQIPIKNTRDYKEFDKHSLLIKPGKEFVGDNSLKQMLYLRQLAGAWNPYKIEKAKELLESTDDRTVIFYNFHEELEELTKVCKSLNKPIARVDGEINDLTNYESHTNCVVLVQYQAGASGINLQKANKMIYFTLPLSSELMEQSKKRIHRLGQTNKCMYYYLIVENSIEERIFKVLEQRKDYTVQLFE